MKFKIPTSIFDQNLKEQPVDKLEWEKFIETTSKDLETVLTEKEKLPYYEILGYCHRVLKNLKLAEEFLEKAVGLSAVESPSKQIQNLIRLAHVYQDQKQFSKSQVLFNQVRELLNRSEISDTLKAAYHQHLGKYYFDQTFYELALAEFELAYKIRLSVNAPQDQIQSTELALSVTRNRIENHFMIELATEKDVCEIRKLANAAYKELADLGLNYTATYQDEAETLKRMKMGRCFLLKQNQKILGTILFYKENYFNNQNTAYVGQFAVWPEYKRHGYGTILMDYCENLAKTEVFEGIQLDTAIPAKHLVNWYLKRGYNVIGEQQWEGKTYRSYIFQKDLA